MKTKIILAIATFFNLFISCGSGLSKESNGEKLIAQRLSLYGDAMKGNLTVADSLWSEILINDTKTIGYLINNVDSLPQSLLVYRRYSRTNQYSVPMYTEYLSPTEMTLYLINAIYYKDMYFASSPHLHYNDLVDYMVYNNDTIWIEANNQGLPTFNSSDQEITHAWTEVRKWYSTYKKNIQKAREDGVRPFGTSDLYWYGEKGSRVNLTRD